MSRGLDLLEGAISATGWICGLLALVTPIWFAIAALGTKWAFWDWQFGLEFMIMSWGPNMILACVIAAVLTGVLIIIHRFVADEFFGVISAPVLALIVGVSGGTWMYVSEQDGADIVSIIDVTTNPVDPPHFTAGFAARRSQDDQSLNYADKQAGDGRDLHHVQTEAYPAIVTLTLNEPPDLVFRRALNLARDEGWRIGTASESAGMFEAGAESFWFGFRDDIVVRVRADDEGGSLVDVRSLARIAVDDRGRNAQRVQAFLLALSETQAGAAASS
jgi:hypothetical protein